MRRLWFIKATDMCSVFLLMYGELEKRKYKYLSTLLKNCTWKHTNETESYEWATTTITKYKSRVEYGERGDVALTYAKANRICLCRPLCTAVWPCSVQGARDIEVWDLRISPPSLEARPLVRDIPTSRCEPYITPPRCVSPPGSVSATKKSEERQQIENSVECTVQLGERAQNGIGPS